MLLGDLKPHLNPITVGVVEHLLGGPDQKVGFWFQGLGTGGVGDLLDADDDLHIGVLLRR